MFWIKVVAAFDALLFLIVAAYYLRYRRSGMSLPKKEQPKVGEKVFLSVLMALVCIAIAYLMIATPLDPTGVIALVCLELLVFLVVLSFTLFSMQEINERRWVGWRVSFGRIELIKMLEFRVKTRVWDTVHYFGGFRSRNISGRNPKTGLTISVRADFEPIDRTSSIVADIGNFERNVELEAGRIESFLNQIATEYSATKPSGLSEEQLVSISDRLHTYQPQNQVEASIRFGKQAPQIRFEAPSPIVLR